MASGPITSWQVGGKTMEIVRDFILLGSKIIADGDCSHDSQRCLLAPWKKSYEQPRPFIREGNGSPLQYSCLETPMDGGAW